MTKQNSINVRLTAEDLRNIEELFAVADTRAVVTNGDKTMIEKIREAARKLEKKNNEG